MYKTIVIPSNKEMINNISSDAILLGIKDLSVNMPFYITLDELKKIKTKKEIFISLNKNFNNSELGVLKKTLLELNDLDIKGVFFYDISIVNLKEKLNLKYDLVWNQEHMTTNYLTVNYWLNKGVNYTCLSNEITTREIKEITQNTKSKIIIQMFGYVPIMNSKRHLINNYLKEFNLKNKSKINYIEKEENKYPIIDSENGTVVYTSKILNGIKDVIDTDLEYILLNSFMIDESKFKEVLEMFKTVNNENKNEYYEKINNMFNADTLFLHKETIYKVK